MTSTDRHIIHKLTVEVTTPSIREGYALRNNVRAFVDKHVVPAVEKYISELESEIGPQEYLQIDRLDITVNAQSADLEASGFSSAIRNEIADVFRRKKLDIPATRGTANATANAAASFTAQRERGSGGLPEAGDSESGMRRVSPGAHGVGTLFYFLEHGTRPWWSTDPAAFNALLAEEQLLGFAANEPAFRQQFLQKIQLSYVRRRLVRQFSDTFLAQLVRVLQAPGLPVEPGVLPESVKAALEVLFRSASGNVREQLWHFLLQELGLSLDGRPKNELALAIALKRLLSEISGAAGAEMQAKAAGHGTSSGGTSVSGATSENTADTQTVLPGTAGTPAAVTGTSGRNREKDPKAQVELKRLELQVMSGLQIVHLLSGRSETAAHYKQLLQHAELFGDTEKGPATSGTTKTGVEHKSNVRQTGASDATQLPAADKSEPGEAPVNDEQRATDERPGNDTHISFRDKPDAPAKSTGTADSSQESAEKAEPRRESAQEEPEHLIVDNAGLVLLHPYIRRFFDTVGLTDGKKLTDPVLAAHVLHYLATGNECAYEHEMQFEKYLAGIPFTESIERQISLSDALKTEAHELLESVKANWKPMNGSSAEAIRETFLQRSGKLFNEAQPRLIVERKTVDILLDQLPWGTSIVKLPWMEHLLFVEW